MATLCPPSGLPAPVPRHQAEGNPSPFCIPIWRKSSLTCINQATGTCARRLLQAQLLASTAQRDYCRGRLAAGCSRLSGSIYQPSSVLEPSGAGSGRRHRRGRPAPANSFTPRPSFLAWPILLSSWLALDQFGGGLIRRGSSIRRCPSPGRGADVDRRAGRSGFVCGQRHYRPQRHAQISQLKEDFG
jgi:hypothetical protein